MADDQWYYNDKGEYRGPIEMATLRRLALIGQIDSETPVWREGLDGWEPARLHVAGARPRGVSSAQAVATPAAPKGQDYQQRVSMGRAFVLAFQRYFDFAGRSNRGEYWWFILANVLIGALTGFFDGVMRVSGGIEFTNLLWSLVVMIPSIALTTRRLHDVGHSGWWQVLPLLALILVVPAILSGTAGPIIAAVVVYAILTIMLLVVLCRRGEPVANRFG